MTSHIESRAEVSTLTASDPRMFEIVERLHAEFGPAHARRIVLAVVEVCRTELDAVPDGERPSVLDRLVRQQGLRAPHAPATSAGDLRAEW